LTNCPSDLVQFTFFSSMPSPPFPLLFPPSFPQATQAAVTFFLQAARLPQFQDYSSFPFSEARESKFISSFPSLFFSSMRNNQNSPHTFFSLRCDSCRSAFFFLGSKNIACYTPLSKFFFFPEMLASPFLSQGITLLHPLVGPGSLPHPRWQFTLSEGKMRAAFFFFPPSKRKFHHG